MPSLSRAAQRTIAALEKQIRKLSEQGESADRRAREIEAEISRIDEEIRAASLEAYSGDEKAKKEAARLEERRFRLVAEARVARGASQTAEERLPALQAELSAVKEREAEALSRAEHEEAVRRYEELKGRREALFPKLEDAARVLTGLLREASDLSREESYAARDAGVAYQDRWTGMAETWLRCRLLRAGVPFDQDPFARRGPLVQLPLYHEGLDGRGLPAGPGA